jgi:hypothetical protein
MANEISKFDDTIDVRDIIERVEELEADQPIESDDDLAELNSLKSLLADLSGNGGDHKWEGDWYPVTLIRDSYFEDYAQELVEDDLGVRNGIPSYIVIDWKATARNIQQNYTSVEFEDVTFWHR